ncbi:hypothetical protein L1887_48459 [Cichorium endivia]|nr:hypothetical protein L1887_48459 [Cichorium endivia]
MVDAFRAPDVRIQSVFITYDHDCGISQLMQPRTRIARQRFRAASWLLIARPFLEDTIVCASSSTKDEESLLTGLILPTHTCTSHAVHSSALPTAHPHFLSDGFSRPTQDLLLQTLVSTKLYNTISIRSARVIRDHLRSEHE